MQHYILRCKHCGVKYTYCTHGNENGCSMDYCGECQTVINDALSKKPKKIEKRLDYITDSEEVFRLNEIFNIEKSKYENEKKDLPRPIQLIGDWGYKTVEKCYINRVEYYRCIKDDDTIDIKVAKEDDLINNEYTGFFYVELDCRHGEYEYVPVEQFRLQCFQQIL